MFSADELIGLFFHRLFSDAFGQKFEKIEDMAQEVEVMIESFGEDILEHVPIDILLGLIKLFLAPMSPAFWDSLRS